MLWVEGLSVYAKVPQIDEITDYLQVEHHLKLRVPALC